jgi:hypothetical protein
MCRGMREPPPDRRSGFCRSEQLELGADVDRRGEASGYWAEARMNAVHSLCVRPSLLGDREPIVDSDSLDHEDAVVGLDLAGRLDLVALGIDLDLTRLQRVGKGAGQSASGRRNDVVKRRGVRRILPRIDAVMLSDLRVNPERDGTLLCGKIRQPLRPAEPFDPDSRNVTDFSQPPRHYPLIWLDCHAGDRCGEAGAAELCSRSAARSCPRGAGRQYPSAAEETAHAVELLEQSLDLVPV